MSKNRKKNNDKTNCFFIAAMGPGEIGQGLAFAKYANDHKTKIIFSVPSKQYLPLVTQNKKNLTVLLIQNSNALKRALHKYPVDVLVLCNSKIFNSGSSKTLNLKDNFSDSPPEPLIPTISIDSNWLFFPKSPYISNPWVDKYCVNIPKPVFRLGLKNQGGHYSIPQKVFKKIRLVGLLPSFNPIKDSVRIKIRKSFGIKKDEKLIFLYTSIGRLTKPVVFEKLEDTVQILHKKGYKIKVVYFGDPIPKISEKKYSDWFIARPRTKAEKFFQVLASSDLVFQHQGLGTLEQAIGAQIPDIAIVRDRKNERNSRYHRHAWEVGPFARFGACAMFYFNSSTKKISQTVEALLFNNKIRVKMQQKQRLLYSKGEKNVFNEAKQLLKSIN